MNLFITKNWDVSGVTYFNNNLNDNIYGTWKPSAATPYFDSNLNDNTYSVWKSSIEVSAALSALSLSAAAAATLLSTCFDSNLDNSIYNTWKPSTPISSPYFDKNLYVDDIEITHLEIISKKIIETYLPEITVEEVYTEKFLRETIQQLKNNIDIFDYELRQYIDQALSYISECIYIFSLNRKIKSNFFSFYITRNLNCNMLIIIKNNLVLLNLFRNPSFIIKTLQ